MVEEIYRRYKEIEESSKEIEQIINIYLKLSYIGDDKENNGAKEEVIYNNLAANTFNYMIETD